MVHSKASNDSAASADYNGIANVMEHKIVVMVQYQLNGSTISGYRTF